MLHNRPEEGDIVELLDLCEPGDLVFFDNATKVRIVHVGVILTRNDEGDLRVAHASGRVRIDKLDQQGIFNAEVGEDLFAQACGWCGGCSSSNGFHWSSGAHGQDVPLIQPGVCDLCWHCVCFVSTKTQHMKRSTLLFLLAFTFMGDLLAQEFKIITIVESIVPMGIGRSRLIESTSTINSDAATTVRTDGKKSDQGDVDRGDLKVDNFKETKLLNFFSGAGINFPEHRQQRCHGDGQDEQDGGGRLGTHPHRSRCRERRWKGTMARASTSRACITRNAEIA
jgi:hypothetical protein